MPARKRLNVADLAELQGKRQLTMLRIFTVEEAAAAEEAGAASEAAGALAAALLAGAAALDSLDELELLQAARPSEATLSTATDVRAVVRFMQSP